ncbi:MAG: site-2 protease family protein [Burkholderiales bacterium]|nr:site-2 protease family protein [Burkholderiales bacterium]
MESFLVNIILFGVPLVLAVTLHEAAHGYTARKFGDRTAEMLGRITLNPIKHVDPVGTVLFPLGLYVMTYFMSSAGMIAFPFLFGWAKPVPVQPRNFKDPVRNMRWVSAAGPLSNLAMALAWAIIGKLLLLSFGSLNSFMVGMVLFGIWINLLLMVFNLLPILPLDGGRILYSFLPWKWAMTYSQTERYGLIIVVILLVAGALGPLIKMLVVPGFGLIRGLFGI